MILVAERMFAELGIYAVSLRQINIEADQRNGSALHYHFGSREGLLSSIFECRMEPINNYRLEMLEDLKDAAAPELPDLRSLLQAMLIPVSRHLAEPGKVTYYSRFMSQTASTFSHNTREFMDNKHDSGSREIRRLVRSSLRDIPEPIILQRAVMAERASIHSFATFESMKEQEGGSYGAKEYDLLVNNMADSFFALLTAPVSDKTQEALRSFSAAAE